MRAKFLQCCSWDFVLGVFFFLTPKALNPKAQGRAATWACGLWPSATRKGCIVRRFIEPLQGTKRFWGNIYRGSRFAADPGLCDATALRYSFAKSHPQSHAGHHANSGVNAKVILETIPNTISSRFIRPSWRAEATRAASQTAASIARRSSTLRIPPPVANCKVASCRQIAAEFQRRTTAAGANRREVEHDHPPDARFPPPRRSEKAKTPATQARRSAAGHRRGPS